MNENTSRAPESPYYEAVETLPRADLERLQENRLLEMIPYCYERSPLIRELWTAHGVRPGNIRSLEDFKAKVPFIDKDMIRDYGTRHGDCFGGILCRPIEELGAVFSSSGTTGDPTLFANSWGENEWCGNMRPRDYWALGARPGDYLLYPGLPHRALGPQRAFQKLGGIPIFADHDPREVPRLVELCRRFRPTILLLLSTPLLLGLEQLERDSPLDFREAFSSLKAAVFGGEPLGRRVAALVERWGLPIVQMTSAGDVVAALECPERNGFHAWEDFVLLENLDPETGQPVPDGETGEMVVTSLVDRTVPMVRSRSGDLIKVTREACGCGRTHARFWVLGRVSDEVVIGKTMVLPWQVGNALEEIDETSAALFQIIRPSRKMETLRLRVGYDGEPDVGMLVRRVAESVERGVGVCPLVELVPNAELLKLGPPHKIPRSAKS